MLTEAESTALAQEIPVVAQVKAENRDADLREWGKDINEWVVNNRKVRKEYADLKAEHEKLKTVPRGVMPLKPDSKPEDVAAFRKAFNVPEKPEGYKFAFPADIPEGLIDPEETKGFAALAHSLHVSQDTAQKLIDFETQRAVKIHNDYAKEQNERAEATAKALVEEHKDQADAKVKDALNAAEAFFGKEFRERLEKKQDELGNDLGFIRGLIKLSAYATERGLPGASSVSGAGASTVKVEDIYAKSVHDGHMQAGALK